MWNIVIDNKLYNTFFPQDTPFNKTCTSDLTLIPGGMIEANSIYTFQIYISDLFHLISLQINRFLISLSQRKKKEIDGCTMISRRYRKSSSSHVPGVWKTLDAMDVLSTIRNLFSEWTLSGWNLFTVHSFFSSSSSSFSSRFRPSFHPLLQTRLDEDRPAFINHPLKRNPWRSIINDLATNFEEVPRPNENWPAECILHFRDTCWIDAKPKTRFSYSDLFYLLRTLLLRRGRRGTFTNALWFLKFRSEHRRIVDTFIIARRMMWNLENRGYL